MTSLINFTLQHILYKNKSIKWRHKNKIYFSYTLFIVQNLIKLSDRDRHFSIIFLTIPQVYIHESSLPRITSKCASFQKWSLFCSFFSWSPTPAGVCPQPALATWAVTGSCRRTCCTRTPFRPPSTCPGGPDCHWPCWGRRVPLSVGISVWPRRRGMMMERHMYWSIWSFREGKALGKGYLRICNNFGATATIICHLPVVSFVDA